MKKSSKSILSVLINCGLLLTGALTLFFLSQGYYKMTILGVSEYAAGYDMIDFSADEGRAVMTAISILAIVILVSLAIILTIVNFLSDVNAIKLSKKANKALRTLNLCFIFAIFAFSVIALGCIASLAGEIGFTSVGWALIVNLIVSAVMFILAIVSVSCAKKTK